MPEERISEFREYIANGSNSKNSNKRKAFEFRKMNYLMEYDYDCNSGGGGSVGGGSTATEPVFEDAMKNFEITTFKRNPSLWGDLFGYSRKEIISLPDNQELK